MCSQYLETRPSDHTGKRGCNESRTRPRQSWPKRRYFFVEGLWFGGRQSTFRNLSRIFNVSSRDTRLVQCGRVEIGGAFMTESPGLAEKKVDARA
jgi:hypothetical protein